MPKRPNEFQRLVFLIHQALAPTGAKITESAMVAVPGLGDLREVDVLIETEVGPYRVKIAIESKDHRRKLSTIDIEAIIGKYRSAGGLVVDKVVVVCRNGYSRPVRRRAEAIGITLLTLSAIKKSEIEEAVTPTRSPAFSPVKVTIEPPPKHRFRFALGPFVEQLRIDVPDYSGPVSDILKHGRLVCACHGHDKGSIDDTIREVVKRNITDRPEIMSDMRNLAGPVCCVRCTLPLNGLLVRLGEKTLPIRPIQFHIHLYKQGVPMKLDKYEMKGDGNCREVHHLTAELGGGKMDVVLPNGPQSEKITVNFDRCKFPLFPS